MAETYRPTLAQFLTGQSVDNPDLALVVLTCFNPTELAQLTCASTWCLTRDQRTELWRNYFLICWGMREGVTATTNVKIVSSQLCEGVHKFSDVGFNGCSSPLDHLFWFFPAFRVLLSTTTSEPPLTVSNWKAACHMHARRHSDACIFRCCICGDIEVVTRVSSWPHFQRRWLRPCSCSHSSAHQVCLERRLASNPVAGSCCPICGAALRVTRRFPGSPKELLVATFRDWPWVLQRVFVMLVFFTWMCTLAQRYCVPTTGSPEGVVPCQELYVVMSFAACMMSISVSRRLHYSIRTIWTTPRFSLFARLFLIFVVLAYLVALRVLDPSLWEKLEVSQPFITLPHVKRMHIWMHSSGVLLMPLISASFLTLASGLIFLFWKTSVSLPTVADADDSGEVRSDCALCQLGLCLSNVYT